MVGLLVTWLRRFVAYAVRKRSIHESLGPGPGRQAMYAALLTRAQEAGVARADASFDDLLRPGIPSSAYADDGQRERVPGFALDGIRIR